MRLICYGLTFWIFLRSAAAAPKGGLVYIKALAIFSAALAVYGMVSLGIGSNVLLSTEGQDRVLRASFVNQNAYVTFAVFGALASIAALIGSFSDRAGSGRALRDVLEGFFDGGWIYAMCALVGLSAVTMTVSRGGALAGLLGIAVLFWALRGTIRSVPRVVLAVPAVLAGFAVLFMSTGTVERFDTTVWSGNGRTAIYGQLVEGIGDRPWLGHGAGSFEMAFRPYIPPELAAYEWNLAHSTYLENAFEFGLPAAALFYLVLGVIGWRLFRGVRTRRRNLIIPAFALGCFAVGALHSAVDFSFQFPAIAALFAAILGLGWAQSFPNRRPLDDM